MVSLADIGEFLSGLSLGLVAGALLGPVVRFWLAWKEWERASGEARLTEDAIKRMGRRPWRFLSARERPTRSLPASGRDAS